MTYWGVGGGKGKREVRFGFEEGKGHRDYVREDKGDFTRRGEGIREELGSRTLRTGREGVRNVTL